MTASIIAIVATLISFGVWLWKRKDAAADDPKAQNEKRYEQAEADVVKGDGVGAGVDGSNDLDDLDRLQNAAGKGDQRGPNSNSGQAK